MGADKLAAALAPQHTGLQPHLLSNDDVIALLDGLELVGLLQVTLEVCRLPARALHELPDNPIATLSLNQTILPIFFD